MLTKQNISTCWHSASSPITALRWVMKYGPTSYIVGAHSIIGGDSGRFGWSQSSRYTESVDSWSEWYSTIVIESFYGIIWQG